MNEYELVNATNIKLNSLFGKSRSAWDKGVMGYAKELMTEYREAVEGGYATGMETGKALEKVLLNGAQTWEQASEGGGYEITDEAIARRLCTPSELKRTRNGERRPNSRETWLQVQGRALFQAANMIIRSKYAAEREIAASLGG